MKKHRLSTTISAKHWELLKKHAARLETQQKALEAALECMENNSGQTPALSPEEELWVRSFREVKASVVILHRDILRALMDDVNSIEQVTEKIKKANPTAYMITWYYKKPLKKCSLKEILDAIVHFFKAGNVVDDISYTDDGSYYNLKVIRSMNKNCSEISRVLVESTLESHGARSESEVSENSLFMRIYKNIE